MARAAGGACAGSLGAPRACGAARRLAPAAAGRLCRRAGHAPGCPGALAPGATRRTHPLLFLGPGLTYPALNAYVVACAGSCMTPPANWLAHATAGRLSQCAESAPGHSRDLALGAARRAKVHYLASPGFWRPFFFKNSLHGVLLNPAAFLLMSAGFAMNADIAMSCSQAVIPVRGKFACLSCLMMSLRVCSES